MITNRAFFIAAFLTPIAIGLPSGAQESSPVCLTPTGLARVAPSRAGSTSAVLQSPSTTGSLRLEPQRGMAGSSFVASGSVAAGTRLVRLFWSDEGETSPLSEAIVDQSGAFRLLGTVPPHATPGSYGVCAIGAGQRLDPSSAPCQLFTVDATPPGELHGIVYVTARDGSRTPSPDTEVRLTQSNGVFVATTTTDRNGEYRFAGLPPGRYTVRPQKDGHAFAGEPQTVEPGVSKGADVVDQKLPNFPVARVDAVGAVVLPIGAIAQSGYPSPIPIFDLDRELGGSFWARWAYLPGHGADVIIRFYAESVTFFSSSTERSVKFQFFKNDQLLYGSTSHQPEPVYSGDAQYAFPAYSRLFNVSDFPPGDMTLRVTPVVDGVEGPSREHLIRIVDLDTRWFNQHVVSPPAKLRVFPGLPEIEYQFIGNETRPLLPISEPIDVLIKTFDNTLDGAASMRESFHTRDGFIDAGGLFFPEVTVFDKQLVKGSYPYGVSFDSAGQPNYWINNFTAAGPTTFLTIPLYKNGPGIGCVNACFVGCEVCAGWKIWADATIGGQIDVASHVGNQLAWDFDLVPFANVTIGGHARAKLVFCSASGNITGTAQVGLPLHYDNHTPMAELQSPCVQVSGTLDASLGCFGFELGGDGAVGPYAFGNCPQPATPPPVTSAKRGPRHYSVDAEPAIAQRADGAAIAVWMELQQGPLETLSPRLLFSLRSAGGWSAASPVMTEPRAINNARVVFLSDGRALAVWVQNRASLAEIARAGGAEMFEQEIMFAIWDGESWGSLGALTDDLVADGMPDLVALPDGSAIAAWVRKIPQGRVPDPSDPIGIVTTRFDGETWGEIKPLSSQPAGLDSQVRLTAAATGAAWAVFVRDLDSNLQTFDDRELWVSRLARNGAESLIQVTSVPQGAFSPTIALDTLGNPLVVFLVPSRTGDRQLTDGSGSGSTVWYARQSGETWQTAAVGKGWRAEDPKLAIGDNGRALIVGRGFIDHPSDSQYGELMAAVATLGPHPLEWSLETLSGDGMTNWQTDLALSPNGTTALVTSVKQSPYRESTPRALEPRARYASGVRTLSLGGGESTSQVSVSEIALGSDLSIEPDSISFSNNHPRPGELIRINARVQGRGLGSDSLSDLNVEFFAREHASRPARKIGEQRLDRTIRFAESATATIDYRVPGRGEVTIWAVVNAARGSQELDLENNRAERVLGKPPVPEHVSVLVPTSAMYPQITWDPPQGETPSGYMIYRAERSDGVFDPIGSSVSPRFTDTLAGPGDRYFYRVSLLDECGVESPMSESARSLVIR